MPEKPTVRWSKSSMLSAWIAQANGRAETVVREPAAGVVPGGAQAATAAARPSPAAVATPTITRRRWAAPSPVRPIGLSTQASLALDVTFDEGLDGGVRVVVGVLLGWGFHEVRGGREDRAAIERDIG